MDFNLDNLNFDMPPPPPAASTAQLQPQQQISSRSSPISQSPQFTGVAGLPIGGATSASNQSPSSPGGAPPLPQPQAQQGPPLTEADFKDITGGENYGAPAGDDFGLGQAQQMGPANSRPSSKSRSSDDMPDLSEFGGPSLGNSGKGAQKRGSGQANNGMNVPDFGAFGMLGNNNGNNRADNSNPFGNSNGFDDLAQQQQQPDSSQGDNFDSFASQPRGDQATTNAGAGGAPNGASGAPSSLQSLLGNSFPGLASGSGAWDPMNAGNNNNNGQSRSSQSNNPLELGDMSDQAGDSAQYDQPEQIGMGGGGGGNTGDPSEQQGGGSGDFPDFNFASAAAEEKPVYKDADPQFVGTVLALSQPQSLSSTRYNTQIDKGTYQDYPMYSWGGNDFSQVARVVSATPTARAAAAGRYGTPSLRALSPEVASQLPAGQQYDYSREPSIREAALNSLV